MSTASRSIHCVLSITTALCLASVFATAEYRENRELTLDALNLADLEVEAGAGSLDIRGVDGLDRIEAKAEIVVDRISQSNGQEYVARTVVFELRNVNGKAKLVAEHRGGLTHRDWSTRVNLVVLMPTSMPLSVDDDSGDLEIQHLTAGLRLRDDSGDSTVRDIAGGATIDDDSGQLIVENIEGSLKINDDSGDLAVHNIIGSVSIEDDSGDIEVGDVTGDVDIEDDSGDITVSTVQGHVTINDDSGDISATDISGGLDIPDAGSGNLQMDRVRGVVRVDS